jgi:hypothetical protein
MATYKTANNLPILEEVTENTYALVEDNGTLKRVSGSNLGGSKSNFCVINIDYSNVAMESSAEGTDDSGVTYFCNMDYNELMEAIQNKTLDGISVNAYMEPMFLYMSCTVSQVFYGTDAPGIMFNITVPAPVNEELTLQLSSDNIITRYVDNSPI